MKPILLANTLISALAITSCSPGVKQGGIEKPNQPNVLFLFADDQRADALGCAGNPNIKTPNIDKLADNGVRFTNTLIMGGHHGAICAPSRAMLLSGKHLFNVYDRLEGVETMPMYFGEHGYETFGTGKWHNEKSAFEAAFQKGRNVFLGGMADHFNIALRDLDANGKLSDPVMKGFSTDMFAGAAIDFLNDYAAGSRDNPFFCYVSFTVPHDPYSPHPDYLDMYSQESLPLPGNFMPLHPFAFDLLNVRDENLLDWPRDPDMVKAVLADYYGLVSHLDDKVGEIVEVLKKNGLYENTIIVYTADNGLAIGSHGLLGKQNLYEHSMKVPLIISGPGIPKGAVTDALAYLFDLYPTLAGLSGLPAPADIDGVNLAEIIYGKTNEVRQSLFTAYRHTIRAVRNKEWKLIRYPELDHAQLFNLINDPLELNNLAIHTEYVEKLAEMMELLTGWQRVVNDTVPLTAKNLKPMDYDHNRLQRKPDQWQPEYTLKKYFGN